jgi:hypothetical protein
MIHQLSVDVIEVGHDSFKGIILLERPTHTPWSMVTRISDVALPSRFPDVALQPLMAGRADQAFCAFGPRVADIPAVAANAGCALGASRAASPRRACPSLQFHVSQSFPALPTKTDV